MNLCKLSFLLLTLVVFNVKDALSQRLMENLNRGLVAVSQDNGKVYIGWRLLATDAEGTAFNLYRSANGKTEKLNNKPITGSTNFIDGTANLSQSTNYVVRPVVKGKETGASEPFVLSANAPAQQYFSISIQPPAPGEVMGSEYTYSANDASVGDLDGDGEYEIVLKWDPSNSRNPPQTGFTGPQIIDAYKMNGKLLWRINLGRNVRAGAAYTQFLVYDFDGDGKAEMICKTADGTIDGKGKIVGDSSKDWRTYGDAKGRMYGKVADGPEYLTVFNGLTGEAMASAAYVPTRYPLDGWGGIGGNGGNDNTASRSDRFTACVAYLDGKLPSAVMVRGWYGRSVLAAWDWRNGKLTQRWVFDSKDANNPYSGMGNHNLSVADMDDDGKDEVCIGAMTVDDDGRGLYTTGLRHGDALHLSDLDPSHPGLEVFGIHESEEKTEALMTPGVAQFDARTGKILFSLAPGVDVGRGVAADIDPTHEGFENWGGPGGLRDTKGKTISEKTPSSTNFVIWWDDDLTRELLDGNHIDKWDWETQTTNRLLTAEECVSNNGTKATPVLSADLFGDWREEVIWRTKDSKELRIYTTTIPSAHRFYTLMHDPQYRLSVAWQNVSYNQPPHTGFYLGAGMKKVPKPNIKFNQSNKPFTTTGTIR
jgi:rhamnogalacturonan endolyase